MALMNGLFFTKNLVLGSFRIYVALALLMIAGLTGLSIIKKKMNLYTIASGIYLLLAIINFEFNKYLCIALILIWAIIHMLNHKQNKPYWFVIFSAVLVLYEFIVIDLKIWDKVLMFLIGFLAYTYAVSRIIFGKQKIVEYIVTAILYLVALGVYKSMTDAMIFTSLLVLFVILGYQKKIGPLFLTSLCFVVINAYQLTEEFWKQIPWWIYLVSVGGILLVFAIHNEAEENKNQAKLKSAIQKMKENVDI